MSFSCCLLSVAYQKFWHISFIFRWKSSFVSNWLLILFCWWTISLNIHVCPSSIRIFLYREHKWVHFFLRPSSLFNHSGRRLRNVIYFRIISPLISAFQPTIYPTLLQLNIVIIIKDNCLKLLSKTGFLVFDGKPHCYEIPKSNRYQN